MKAGRRWWRYMDLRCHNLTTWLSGGWNSMTVTMSFPVPPTQAYMEVEVVGDDGDVDGQVMTVDDWYWRWWCTIMPLTLFTVNPKLSLLTLGFSHAFVPGAKKTVAHIGSIDLRAHHLAVSSLRIGRVAREGHRCAQTPPHRNRRYVGELVIKLY